LLIPSFSGAALHLALAWWAARADDAEEVHRKPLPPRRRRCAEPTRPGKVLLARRKPGWMKFAQLASCLRASPRCPQIARSHGSLSSASCNEGGALLQYGALCMTWRTLQRLANSAAADSPGPGNQLSVSAGWRTLQRLAHSGACGGPSPGLPPRMPGRWRTPQRLAHSAARLAHSAWLGTLCPGWRTLVEHWRTLEHWHSLYGLSISVACGGLCLYGLAQTEAEHLVFLPSGHAGTDPARHYGVEPARHSPEILHRPAATGRATFPPANDVPHPTPTSAPGLGREGAPRRRPPVSFNE